MTDTIDELLIFNWLEQIDWIYCYIFALVASQIPFISCG
ncbi:hypothetical protein C942_04310 [Photobacterium marinum]|uniref:Uncharacterized protein n=1 Tax=Photobacterium marinum TaxID=1056511 RepID=L8JGR7_9GAMM|nr:hypothetical protein C942_04310 [Photobacterium marinum]